MNVLWLTPPFKKEDILSNKDAVWVYTENALKKGGGEMMEWVRGNDNCHSLITRETIGEDGYFREDNIIKTTRIIKDNFHGFIVGDKYLKPENRKPPSDKKEK